MGQLCDLGVKIQSRVHPTVGTVPDQCRNSMSKPRVSSRVLNKDPILLGIRNQGFLVRFLHYLIFSVLEEEYAKGGKSKKVASSAEILRCCLHCNPHNRFRLFWGSPSGSKFYVIFLLAESASPGRSGSTALTGPVS